MNVVDELRNLDVNDVGRWPLPFRIAVIVLVFVVVNLFIAIIINNLEAVKGEETAAADARTGDVVARIAALRAELEGVEDTLRRDRES